VIIIHSEEELKLIRVSNRIVAEVLHKLKEFTKPGITTEELDTIAEELIRERGGTPAFKGYKGFPAAICASVNEQIVHGIPGPGILRDGDIISIDVGAEYRGYFGDAAITVAVGKINPEKQRLMKVTRESLLEGIKKATAKNRLSDISHAIQSYVENHGFSIVREFVGHGIGSSLHEEPQIPNFGKPGRGPRLKPGMVLAIEPMVNMGSYEVEIEQDNWTAIASDGKPSAHFEHTIIVTDKEPEIITLRKDSGS